MIKPNGQQLVTDERVPVTVVGLGNMGSALARALLRAGYPVTVWNRTAHRAERLAAEGAVPIGQLSRAVTASGVVVVCLSTSRVVEELLRPLKNQLAGRTLINVTTGTPREVRHIAGWAADSGAHYLSGAIMATPSMIQRPDTLIFYGGSPEVFEAHRRLLAAFGGRAQYLGPDPGVASLYDLALLTVLYGAWYGYLHAHALLQRAGITATAFLPYVREWVESVIVPSLTDPAEAAALDQRDYQTDESNLAVNAAALGLITRASREAGIASEWLTPIHRLASEKLKEGFGADSFLRVFDGILGGHDQR